MSISTEELARYEREWAANRARQRAMTNEDFARIGAALGMKVDDVYVQQRRLWVRLH